LTNIFNPTESYYSIDEDGDFCEWEDFYQSYPHLFQKLEWWQERNLEELPKYIKYMIGDKNGAVYKIESWNLLKGYALCERGEDYPLYLMKKGVLPATKEEYDLYKSIRP
jgi:hypothetical protein